MKSKATEIKREASDIKGDEGMSTPRITSMISEVIQSYIDRRISRTSAALAYFLALSIFPMIICLYAMLGDLFPAVQTIESLLDGLLPRESVDIIKEYLSYVSANKSVAMIVTAAIAMLTTGAAAFRTIHNAMGEISGEPRFAGFFSFFFSLMFSLIFLFAIYFAVLVMITGGWFINFVDEHVSFLNIAASWEWIRFILLFALLLLIIYGLYRITAAKDSRIKLFKGAVAASIALEIVSIIFSYFISFSTRYSVLYGSLAAIMILLFWLYICGNILLLGNIINVAIYNHTPIRTDKIAGKDS